MDQVDIRVRGEGHIDLVLDRSHVVTALSVDLSITALAGSMVTDHVDLVTVQHVD